MLKGKNFGGLAAVAILIGSSLSIPPAQAGYIVTLQQQGADVVATGSGTLDLTDLTLFLNGVQENARIWPGNGQIFTGPAATTGFSVDGYIQNTPSITGPSSLGSASITGASSGSGDLVGISGGIESLVVPHGYVSDNTLSSSATWDNATFASLGVTPGTYEWTWGSGADADSFTLQIGAVSVPEPDTLTLLGTTVLFGLLLAILRRRSLPVAIVGGAVERLQSALA